MKRKRLYSFDILKIIASALIVFHHYQQMTGVIFRGINFYGGNFNFGFLVELFFTISGFLTVYSDNDTGHAYIDCSDSKQTHNFKHFTNKCLRLYPSVWASQTILLMITFIYFVIYRRWIFNETYGVMQILTSFLLINQGWAVEYFPAVNNPTWYLDVLLLCYIWFYLIKSCTKKKEHLRIWIYFILIGGAIIVRYFHIFFIFFHNSSTRGYVSFFIGAVLCTLKEKYSDKKIYFIQIILLLMSFAGIVFRGIGDWYVLVIFVFPALVLLSASFNTFRALTNLYIRKLIDRLKPEKKFIESLQKDEDEKHNNISFRYNLSNLLTVWGGVSFEVYLWHMPVFEIGYLICSIAGITVTHSYLTMITFLIIVEITAVLIYIYFEQVIQQKLKRYIK